MQYYLAPMEGITTYIYRNAYARYFGHVDKYFTPFLASKKLNAKEIRDILPENNKGIELVPQILTNRVDDFLAIADKIASYGYQTVNLNLGCPSGTVTAKNRGAGFLGVPQNLDAFLYEIYEKCPLRISIKTRLGVSDLEEWDALLDIYAKYPVEELIIHTRLQKEFYAGRTHPEAFIKAQDRLRNGVGVPYTFHNTQHGEGNSANGTAIPLCYNGDIVSAESLEALLSGLVSPDAMARDASVSVTASSAAFAPDAIMLGRGLIRNPGLAGTLKAQNPTICSLSTQTPHDTAAAMEPHTNVKQLWLDFHNEILEAYRKIMSGDLPVLFKMKDLWTYMSQSFTDSGKYLKKIRKAERISEYEIAVNALFREQEIIC